MADRTNESSVSRDDWFSAEITNARLLSTKGLCFGTLNNGEEIIIPAVAVKHAPFQHYCHLRAEDVVWCRIEPSRSKGRCRWSAIECRIDGDVPDDNNESGVVVKWDLNGWGVVRRVCGCGIMALSARPFSSGDEVSYRIFPDSKKYHAFIAADLTAKEN